jgi:hypothetical protein
MRRRAGVARGGESRIASTLVRILTPRCIYVSVSGIILPICNQVEGQGMQPGELFSPPIEQNISPTVPYQRFTTPTEMLALATQYANYWKGLIISSGPSSDDGVLSQVTNQIENIANGFRNEVQRLLGNLNTPQEEYQRALARNMMTFRAHGIFYPESAEAAFITRVSASSPIQALRVAVCLINNVQWNISNTSWPGEWLRAGALASAFQNGWIDPAPEQRQALEALKREWDTRLSEIAN